MIKKIRPKTRKNLPTELISMGRHLVYSEGKCTEPNYIESIKNEISLKYRCSPNDIEIINANGAESFNTIRIIDESLDDIKRRLSSGETINHVWYFFDKDEFPDDNYNKACNFSKRMNNSTNINDDGFHYNTDNGITYHTCYSNEAFELWLCLYFEYLNSSLSRDRYITKIEEYIRKNKPNFSYKKNIKNIHQILEESGGNIGNAIKYAKKLVNDNGNKNPSTNVVEFAEFFKAYMK